MDTICLEQKVKEIVARQLILDASEITLESSFVRDLGADSLDTVELIMAFEDEFGIEIPDEDEEKIVSVKDAVEYIVYRKTTEMKPDQQIKKLTLEQKYEIREVIIETLDGEIEIGILLHRGQKEYEDYKKEKIMLINQAVENITKIVE